MRSLFAAALLLCCARQVVGDGCGSPGFSMAPVFWSPQGSIYGSSDCSGEAVATCSFTGDYSVGVGSVAILCPSNTPGTFTFTLQAAGQSGQVSGKSGECAGVGEGGVGVSAKITCQPGLLLVLIIVLLVLGLLVGLCVCCCCGCCGRRGGAGTTISQAQYTMLAPAAPAAAGFYAPAPKPQQGSSYYMPPGAQ
jgi:hypothetical protein